MEISGVDIIIAKSLFSGTELIALQTNRVP